MTIERETATRYLDLTSLDEALGHLRKRFPCKPRTVMVPVQESCGRITAEAVFSPLSVPLTHLSAMDGLAVKSTDTIGATDQKPLVLQDFSWVNTGNVIPDRYDAVIMIEDVEERDEEYLIRSSAHPWQHIRPVGEDIAITEMIVARNTLIRPAEIGAMASYGIVSVPVLELKVALIPTGNEIVPIGTMPQPGQVIESNMHMAAAFLRSAGVTFTHYPIVPDNPDRIRAAVEIAIPHHDIILISAGSSKGTKDYTARIITDLGEVFVHGIGIKPAKPVILGDIRGRPVIGIPGYPIACHTILREIVTPLIRWYGFQVSYPDTIPVQVTTALHSEIGTDEFVLATAGKIQERWIAAPLSRGSGVQMSMVRSNAYLKIPSQREGLEAGEETTAYLTVPRKTAEQVVLITGSHDPVIDHLADLVRDDGIILASSHVGSMGGLLTLKRGDCHLAPMHILADNGDYNIPYLQKYFPEKELVLICVAEREQGIVSRDGLAFDDIISYPYINRQRGSGTRLLLDHLLRQKNIAPDIITGYNREVTTHLGVCLAIRSGDADIGMAVYSAAKAFDLRFTPVGTERYELVTTREMYEKDPRIQAIAEMISSEKCRQILEKLGGYRTRDTGIVRRCNIP